MAMMAAEYFDDVCVDLVGSETDRRFVRIEQCDAETVVLTCDQMRQVMGYAIRAGLFEPEDVHV